MIIQGISAASGRSSSASSSITCSDIHHCRTIPSIIFNCTSTILLCTWVALHIDVPKNPQNAWWRRPLHRIKWVMVALLAPEVILAKAFLDWIMSSRDLKRKLEADPACGWTETHGMLARMGGIRAVQEDHSGDLYKHIDQVSSDVAIELIQDRGKGDGVVKAITVIQTLWFAIQAAHRISRGLVVTELELATLAHVTLNIFVYWCWWNKPLNIGVPVQANATKHGERQEGRLSEEGMQAEGNKAPGDTESQRPTPRQKLSIRVRLGAYIDRILNGQRTRWGGAALLVACTIIGGTFGIIHCLAWNSTFPTRIEQTIWRVAAFVVTAFPGVGLTIMWLVAMNLDKKEKMLLVLGGLFISVYSIARICLVALAMAALRALPDRAYEIPTWTIYVPHIG